MQQTYCDFCDFLGFTLDDDGHAWTLAAQRSFGEHWNVTLEGISVDSTVPLRNLLAIATTQREHQLQLALRYER